MASEGPRSPGTTGNDATVGTIDWTTPGNITASDNAYATVAGANTSHYLTATNFGFADQSPGTTTSVVAEIEQSKANGGIEVSVKLLKGGTISGTDKSTGATLPDADAYTTYTWTVPADITLTPANVAASTFGVAFATSGAGAPANRKVDHIRMTHNYTAAAVGNPKAMMIIAILFAVIRFALPFSAAESFIRFLLRTVIPSEKRSECCVLKAGIEQCY